jgi:succinoglycan biosynthesis protein ExoA
MNEDGVTIVLPVLNEERTVADTLEGLARQTFGAHRLEVLVYDGGSIDRTVDICRSFVDRARWKRFEILPNPQVTVPFALNAGLAESRCLWFLRVDGRTRLSPEYVEECVAWLRRVDPPAAVGGRFRTEAEGAVAESIAAAVTHPIGVGRGFRTARHATEVDHHPFAVWKTEDVRRLGAFDFRLTRNQDDAFSLRAIERGWRIHLNPSAMVVYRPRQRLRGLAVQYFQYGLWKAVVAAWHGLFPRRSALPAGLVLFAGVALKAASRHRYWPGLALLSAYAAAGFEVSRSRLHANPLLTGSALLVIHLSYGAGVLVGWARPTLAEGRLGASRFS